MGFIRGVASNLVLYWASGSPPAWRVQICLEEKDLGGYQSKLLTMSKGEHKSAEMLAMNPRGQVPVLKDGDNVLTEAAAICDYLESEYKNRGTRLIPDDKKQKARVITKSQEATNLYNVTRAFMMYMFTVPKEKQDQSVVKQKKTDIRNELLLWEDHLAKQNSSYIAGEKFSMADVAVFPHVAFFVRQGFKLGPPHFTRLGRYYDDLKTRPSISKTWPPHWKDTPQGSMLSDAN